MEKPLNLRIEEVRNQMANVINEANLPAYILKPIIKDFYTQLQNLEQQELIQAQKQYEKSLKAEKSAENKE